MLSKIQKAEVLFAIVLFAFAVRFSWMDELSEANLSFHMTTQHILTVLAGFILGVQLAKLFTPGRRAAVLFTVAAVILVLFWHIPRFWDAAYSNDLIHISEHLSFFLIGALVAISQPSLGSGLKWSLLIVYLVLNSILSANTIGGRQVYHTSPASQHRELAIVMITSTPVIFILGALSSFYAPKIADFWVRRKLSLYVGGLLIVGFILDILLTG